MRAFLPLFLSVFHREDASSWIWVHKLEQLNYNAAANFQFTGNLKFPEHNSVMKATKGFFLIRKRLEITLSQPARHRRNLCNRLNSNQNFTANSSVQNAWRYAASYDAGPFQIFVFDVNK